MLVESTIRLKFPTPHIWLTKIIGLSNIGLRKLFKKTSKTQSISQREKNHIVDFFIFYSLLLLKTNFKNIRK